MLVRSRRAVVVAACTTLAFVSLPSTATAAAGDATCDSGSFAGGDGSAGAPFQVGTRSALDEVRDCLDKSFVQIADIDLGGVEWEPIGRLPTLAEPNPQFLGTYDGAGYSISGLQITTDRATGIGLFGNTWGFIDNVHVVGGITLAGGGSYVGGLAGFSAGTVQSSTVAVNISAPGYSYTGGAIGENDGSVIEVSASGSVSGNNIVSGLVGLNYVIV